MSTTTKNNWVLMDHIFIALRKAELLVDNGAEGRSSDDIYLTIRQEIYHERPGRGPDEKFPHQAVMVMTERDIIENSEDTREAALRLLTDPRIGENVYGNHPGEPRPPGVQPNEESMARRLAERLSQQRLLKCGLGYPGAAWDQALQEDAIEKARSAILKAVQEDQEPIQPDDVWADNLACWLMEGGVIREGRSYSDTAEALKETFRQVAQPD